MANTDTLSEKFPFKSEYLTVDNDRLHYIDIGEGDVQLFLHGVPMSAYSWRNVIPQVSDKARCIALDFMGYGKSDKPEISYSLDEQYRYLELFIEKLELKNITLVMTDVGGILGQKYARLHPENVSRIVLMETPISDAVTFHNNGSMMQRILFGIARKERLGHKMFVKKNMFIKMMPKLIKRKLTKIEKAAYAEPFETEKSRLAMLNVANGFPKKGKNPEVGDMADYLNKNSEWLVGSNIPKLLLTAKPGMLMNKKVIKWANDNLKNLEVKQLGKAKHLMEEDLSLEIGRAINSWNTKERD